LGKYQGFLIEVFAAKHKDQLQIATRNEATASTLKFNKINENWYTKEVEKSSLELVWEEVIQIKKSNEEYGHIIQLDELLEMRMNQLKNESIRYD